MKKITIILSVLLTISLFAGCNKKEDKQPAAVNTAVEQTKPVETKTEDKPTAKAPEFLEDTNEQVAAKKDNSVKNSTGKEFTTEEQKYVNVAVEGLKEYFSADYTKDWAGFRLNKNIFPDTDVNLLASSVVYFRDKQRSYITKNKLKREIQNINITDVYYSATGNAGNLGGSIIDFTLNIKENGKIQDKKVTATLARIPENKNYFIQNIEDTDTQKTLYLEYKNMEE